MTIPTAITPKSWGGTKFANISSDPYQHPCPTTTLSAFHATAQATTGAEAMGWVSKGGSPPAKQSGTAVSLRRQDVPSETHSLRGLDPLGIPGVRGQFVRSHVRRQTGWRRAPCDHRPSDRSTTQASLE